MLHPRPGLGSVLAPEGLLASPCPALGGPCPSLVCLLAGLQDFRGQGWSPVEFRPRARPSISVVQAVSCSLPASLSTSVSV